MDEGGFGQHWGFQTLEQGSLSNRTRHGEVGGITVEALMSRFGIDYIDFFKVDIEGAEKEVFASSSMWIDKIGVIAIELHDRLKAGCSRSVYLATKNFDWEFRRGETIFMGKGPCPATSSLESDVTAIGRTNGSSQLISKLPCQIVAVH